MPQIDPVILKLEADLADYKRGVAQAERLTDQKLGAIQRSADRMGSGMSKAFNLAKTAALAFVAAHGLGAIKDLITTGLEYAASLAEIAAQAGVSTAALQEYIYAGTQVNLSQEEVVQGLEQLNRRLGDAANGTGTAEKALARLGVELRDTNGQVKNAADIIPEIAEAMKGVTSEAEKGALRQELFGRSGQKMAALLSGGAAGVNNLRDAAHDLGIVLSEKQIQAADDTADKLDKLKMVLSARIAGAVADNVGAIDSLAAALERLINSVGRAIPAMQRFWHEANARYADVQAKTHALSPWPWMRDKVPGFIAESQAYRGQAAGIGQTRPTGGITAGLSALQAYAQQQQGSYTFDPSADDTPGGPAAAARKIGPSAEEIARAMRESAIELDSLAADLARANADLTGNIRDRAEAEKMALEATLARDIDRIETDDLLTAARKQELIAATQQVAAINRQLIDQEATEAIRKKLEEDRLEGLRKAEDRRAQVADIELDALDAEARYADTLREREAAERRLLDLQHEEEINRFNAAVATGEIADEARERAALERRQAAEKRGLAQDQEGPGARYMRELRDEAENLGDAYEEIAVRGLQRLEDSLANAAKNALGLHGVLGDIIGDLIQLAIRRAALEGLDAIFGSAGGGGGGGDIGALFSNLFGRASGGYGAAGRMYRVNEGASPGRVEGWMPAGSGKVIPLGQMEAARAAPAQSGGTVRLVIEEAPGFAARVRAEAVGVSIEVTKQSAGAIIEAAAAETMRRASRPSI